MGDHIRKKRLDLGLTQERLGQIVGVNEQAINSWEGGVNVPRLHLLPKVFNFLGYVPYDPSQPFPKKLRIWRESAGLNQKQLAERIGIGIRTLKELEKKAKPTLISLELIRVFFSG